jgi:hypothetical protein
MNFCRSGATCSNGIELIRAIFSSSDVLAADSTGVPIHHHVFAPCPRCQAQPLKFAADASVRYSNRSKISLFIERAREAPVSSHRPLAASGVTPPRYE